MKKEDYESYTKQEDWELFGYMQSVETDPRRHAAIHILEMRRMQRAAAAAERSAQAARWAAVAAIVSAIATIIGLICR